MSRAQQASKRKRMSRAVPLLGAAGLSLSLAGGASAAAGGPADMPTRNAAVSHEITLAEEDISDVSLATFYIVDQENAGALRPRLRLARGCGCAGCGGCATGTNYGASTLGSDTNPPHHSIKPAHGHRHAARRRHVPKNQ